MHESFQAAVDEGQLADSSGKIDLTTIAKLVKQLIEKYATRAAVLAQFELVWAKVVATNWPRVPDGIEGFVKAAAHAAIVAAINHYLPA